MKKLWKVLIVLLLITAGVLYYFYVQNKPLQVKASLVKNTAVTIYIEEDGICKPRSDLFVQAEYGGMLKKLYVHDGDYVKKGQALFAFDTSETKYQIKQLEAQKASISAMHELELAKLSLDKLTQLYAAGGISRKDYEDALATAQSKYYPAQVEALQATVSQLKVKLGKSVVRAPFAGKIIMDDASAGQIFMPGQNICRIIDSAQIKYEVFALADDAVTFAVGGKAVAVFETEGNETSVPAHITYIAPVADERISPLGLKERRVRVLLAADVKSQMDYPGRDVLIRFVKRVYDKITVVPKTAVIRYDNNQAVWVIKNGRAYMQKIVTGEDDKNMIIVKNGLKENNMIINDPIAYNLREGIRIGGY